LVELLMVFAIMGTLLTVSVQYYSRHIEKVRMLDMIGEVRLIEKAIKTYQIMTGKLPESLAIVGCGQLRDRWGNPYQYLRHEDADETEGNGQSGGGQTGSDKTGSNKGGNDKGGSNQSGGSSGGSDTGGAGQGGEGKGKWRRDRFLNPVNTDYDLYSMGADGRTQVNFNAKWARDDIVRANNGEYVGLASEY
jgi:general secretion pathway protein G